MLQTVDLLRHIEVGHHLVIVLLGVFEEVEQIAAANRRKQITRCELVVLSCAWWNVGALPNVGETIPMNVELHELKGGQTSQSQQAIPMAIDRSIVVSQCIRQLGISMHLPLVEWYLRQFWCVAGLVEASEEKLWLLHWEHLDPNIRRRP